jgi:hypothetical protein
MFNLKKFNAMLLRHNVSKQDLASYLGIKRPSLYRRLSNGGDFNTNEIRLMINLFGKDEVIECLFDCQ